MAKRTRGGILIVAVALAGAVPGCGAFSAYRGCDSPGGPEDQRITAEIRARLAERVTQLRSPNTATPPGAPTKTLPSAITGVMNLLPAPN